MEMIKKILIKNIKELRKAKGWNQEKLAEKAGYSSGFIADIERGKSWVSPEAIDAICGALEVSSDKLFLSVEKGKMFDMPMSKAIKKLSAIPDEVYELGSSFDPNDDVWQDVMGALESALDAKKAKAGVKKSG